MLFAVSFPHRRPGVCRDVQHAHCPVSQTHLCAEEISEPGGPVNQSCWIQKRDSLIKILLEVSFPIVSGTFPLSDTMEQ